MTGDSDLVDTGDCFRPNEHQLVNFFFQRHVAQNFLRAAVAGFQFRVLRGLRRLFRGFLRLLGFCGLRGFDRGFLHRGKIPLHQEGDGRIAAQHDQGAAQYRQDHSKYFHA